MKQLKRISGISLATLLIVYIILFNYFPLVSGINYLLPVLIVGSINFILCAVYFFKGKRDQARSFLLSSLIVLVVGTSSCVTIKPRKKPKKKKKPPVETPPPVHVQNKDWSLKNYYLTFNEKNI